MKFLYYAPISRGGMAEYSHRQASALARIGLDVTMLCSRHDNGPWHRVSAGGCPYTLRPILQGWRIRAFPGPLRRAMFALDLLRDAQTLADVIRREQFSNVLFAAYSEHFAPWWAPSLRRLTQTQGTIFGAVVHDPVRTSGFGPRWWRRRSVAAKYSVLREAFVHSPITLETVDAMPTLRTTVIPQGLYETPSPKVTRPAWRARHELPADAKVLLSFGYIRDNKNLDLVLRAMARFPDLFLVVAGTEQSSNDKNADYYRGLARELDIAERCRWLVGFIADEEIGDIFNACDLLMLTYNRHFRSASAVLNIASKVHIPCLASGGEGNLRSMVQSYGLGSWIEPDDLEALTAGLQAWRAGQMPAPRWESYERDNSWQRNAEIVAEKMDALA